MINEPMVVLEPVNEYRTLYWDLRLSENPHREIRDNIDTIRKIAKYIGNMAGKSLRLDEEEIYIPEEIDVDKLHRDFFADYQDNPVLERAITGEKSVSQTLEELSNFHKGIKKFLYRRKDEKHNKELRYLGELIGYAHYLEKAGIISCDTVIPGILELRGSGDSYLQNTLPQLREHAEYLDQRINELFLSITEGRK